jgi:pheromone a factor receptor
VHDLKSFFYLVITPISPLSSDLLSKMLPVGHSGDHIPQPIMDSDQNFPIYPITVLIPTLSASALVLQIPPLIWHLRNRNLGASCMIGWLSLIQIIYIINPIIWPRDNIMNWWNGHGLCDIEIRILIAATVAIPGSTMVIIRNLAAILNRDELHLPTPSQRRRQQIIDLFLCFGFPVLIMVIYYVVQSNRYTIFTTTGCTWWIERTWLSIVLILIWPLVLAIINTYFAGMSNNAEKRALYLL